MSSSWTEWAVLRYVRERFPLATFLPVVLFLAIPSLLPSGETSRLELLLLLLALVFQFRLWDDLGDLKTDRVEFPERVLGRAPSVTPFYWLWLAAAAGVVFLLRGHRPSLILYLVTVLVGFVWYRWLFDRSPRILRYHVVAFKYPLFVYVAAGLSSEPQGSLLVATMALVYFTFVVYEPLHDARLHRLPRIDAVVAADIALWTTTAVLTSWMARGESAPTSLLLVLPLAAILAITSYRRFRTEADCTLFGRWIFLLAFLALLSVHGGKAWA